MLKRIFDLSFSLLSLIILFPLFIFVSILIKIDSHGPVFFIQERVGLNGKRFYLYKFRTMIKHAEKIGTELTTKNDKRITKIGIFLRKHKIDEFPQLINVLRGEMSFVGPRPELPEYVKIFKEDYKDILKVKPGITDFASISFRNESELMKNEKDAERMYINEILPQKINLYKKYIRQKSFKLDLYIIFSTLFHIIKK